MIDLISNPGEAAAQEREALFAVDGVEVTVPKGNFSADFALRYMEFSAKHGLDAATVWLLENGLSEGGFTLLKTCEGLPAEALATIHAAVLGKVTGALSGPKARLKSA